MKPPYIGMTGFTKLTHVKHTIEQIEKLNTDKLYMFGYLVSGVILNGETTKNKRYLQFKKIREFKNLISLSANHKNVLNMVHFNSRNKKFGDELITLFDEIIDVCQTVQININNPNVEELKKVKEKYPELNILFQINTQMIKNHTNDEIFDIIESTYLPYIDYILIDPSGGAGKSIDLNDGIELFELLEVFDKSMGLAGGFTPENIQLVITELNEKLGVNKYSIDIESGIRTKLSDKYGDDLFNQEKTNAYILNATEVF